MRDPQLLSPRRKLLHHIFDRKPIILELLRTRALLGDAILHHNLHRLDAVPNHDLLPFLDILPLYVLHVLDRPQECSLMLHIH